MLRASLFMAFFTILVLVHQAHAAPRRHSLHGVVGLWTPVGFAGVEGEVMIGQGFGLSAGVGGGPSGVQVAVMPRYHVPLGEHTSIGLGVGVSGGRFVDDEWCLLDETCARFTTERAFWSNGEVAVEWQHPSGLSLRGFGGIGRQLNPGDATCVDSLSRTNEPCSAEDEQAQHVVLPSLGVSFGAAF